MFRLTVPTGGGKTLASLTFALDQAWLMEPGINATSLAISNRESEKSDVDFLPKPGGQASHPDCPRTAG
jgi:hypothetical protein